MINYDFNTTKGALTNGKTSISEINLESGHNSGKGRIIEVVLLIIIIIALIEKNRSRN